MFVNFSNHPSGQWDDEQKQAAHFFGEIRDVSFPMVPALATTEEISRMAEECAREILRMRPDCVMCQGEFTLTLAVVRRLQAAGICCVCACSERKIMKEETSGRTTRKTSVFEFRQFREYEKPNYEKEGKYGHEKHR